LHNEELHNLYSAPDTIRIIKSRMRWARCATCMEDMTNAYKILVRKPEKKRPLGKTVA
jgi:hypothetical protein